MTAPPGANRDVDLVRVHYEAFLKEVLKQHQAGPGWTLA